MEASIKDMLEQGKSTDDILIGFGFNPKTMDPALVAFISTLIAMIGSIDSNLQDMSSKIDDLKELILDRTNRNSSNSSSPPSKDGYRKPNKNRSLRQSSGRKPGAQVGHKGNGLAKIVADETIVTRHYPKECMDCPHRKDCLEKKDA